MESKVTVTTTVSIPDDEPTTDEPATIPYDAQIVIDIGRAVWDILPGECFDTVFKAAVQAAFGATGRGFVW